MATPRLDISFDRHYQYDDLVAILAQLTAQYPALVRLESIGKSHEERDIPLVVITNAATGPDVDKPAFWVDGNIHATELAASAACLYLIVSLLEGYGNDPATTHCLDTRAFYICPRVNPDGAELALGTPPKLLRSGTRTYPNNYEPIHGLVEEDIDRDGRLLSMRIEDPNGNWKVCPEDSRLMMRRDPAEYGGTYYRLLPEGRLLDYDGVNIDVPAPKEGLDFNRNFPAGWRTEAEQKGAGSFPASEPEVRNLIQFIVDHPNITGGTSFHTFSGVILRPFSHKADEEFAVEDLRVYKEIGDKGESITGYPSISVFHEFRYHPKEVITGAFDDWMFGHLGLFSWTIELWSPMRQAGITDYKYIDWFRAHPIEDDLKLLAWNDDALRGEGYVDWYRFDHPELGSVELGGWDVLYSFRNPPSHLLEKEIERFPEWLVWHLLISPLLTISGAGAEPLGDDHYKVTLVLENTGWLPTYVSKHAQTKKLCRAIEAKIDLPEGATLAKGRLRVDLGQLEGRAHKPHSVSRWTADVTSDRVTYEWIVNAPVPGAVTITAKHPRAGTAATEIALQPE